MREIQATSRIFLLLARSYLAPRIEVQHLLGYTKWDNFLNVVSKARTACEISGNAVADHPSFRVCGCLEP